MYNNSILYIKTWNTTDEVTSDRPINLLLVIVKTINNDLEGKKYCSGAFLDIISQIFDNV